MTIICGRMLSALIFSCLTVFAHGQAVYRPTREWNSLEEGKFRQWVSENVQLEMMKELRIQTDCGQFPVAVRLLFARTRELPVLVKGFGSRKLDQDATTWSRDPTVERWSEAEWKQSYLQDRRFQKFLASALLLINTKTLPFNTYPVAIEDLRNPGRISPWVKPGAIVADDRHVRLIVDVNPGAAFPIMELQSTLPRLVRTLLVTPFSLFHFPFDEGRGVRSWLWPVKSRSGWVFLPAEQMEGYSLQQFQMPNFAREEARVELEVVQREIAKLGRDRSIALSVDPARVEDRTFTRVEALDGEIVHLQEQMRAIQHTIQLYQKNPSLEYKGSIQEWIMTLAQRSAPRAEDLRILVDAAMGRLNERVQLVQQAQGVPQARLRNNRSAEYDALSTPDRDRMELFIHSQILRSLLVMDPSSALLREYLLALRGWHIEISPGLKIDLQFWFEAAEKGYVKSAPHLPLEARWGLGYMRELLSTLPSDFDIRMLRRDIDQQERMVAILRQATLRADDPTTWRLPAAIRRLRVLKAQLLEKMDHIEWIQSLCQAWVEPRCKQK